MGSVGGEWGGAAAPAVPRHGCPIKKLHYPDSSGWGRFAPRYTCWTASDLERRVLFRVSAGQTMLDTFVLIFTREPVNPIDFIEFFEHSTRELYP